MDLKTKETILKIRRHRKKMGQKGMILSWENGKLKRFRFRYFDS